MDPLRSTGSSAFADDDEGVVEGLTHHFHQHPLSYTFATFIRSAEAASNTWSQSPSARGR